MDGRVDEIAKKFGTSSNGCNVQSEPYIL